MVSRVEPFIGRFDTSNGHTSVHYRNLTIIQPQSRPMERASLEKDTLPRLATRASSIKNGLPVFSSDCNGLPRERLHQKAGVVVMRVEKYVFPNPRSSKVFCLNCQLEP